MSVPNAWFAGRTHDNEVELGKRYRRRKGHGNTAVYVWALWYSCDMLPGIWVRVVNYGRNEIPQVGQYGKLTPEHVFLHNYQRIEQ